MLNMEKYAGLIKAVMHVSLNTRCNDIHRLKKLCEEHKIYLIEDSAQSLGSRYKGKHLGTFGDIGSFSFSSPKIISTGQGGCLITNNKELSEMLGNTGLWLPSSTVLTDEQIDYICEKVIEFTDNED